MASKPDRPTLDADAKRPERQDMFALEAMEEFAKTTPEERARRLRQLLADAQKHGNN